MDYAVVWDDEGPEDVRIETSGPVVVDELDKMVEEVLADSRFRPNLRILVDHSRASWAAVGDVDLRRRADLVHAQADRIGAQRIAFVVDGRVDLGVMRLLEAYTMVGVPFRAKMFPTVAAAREWL
jgi:stage II sporulation SpoAA-like protein